MEYIQINVNCSEDFYKLHLICDPAVLLLNQCGNEISVYVHPKKCMRRFITVLLIIVKKLEEVHQQENEQSVVYL